MTYTIIALTQHWTILDGAYYRDAWIRLTDGTIKFVGLLDETI